ncbi:hypothetical protein FB451DRAFT_1236892 [Mycena latifolia]|nr:hypothetical protein FB451DRAFT_1236892 [Mycena latifolia]
MSGLNLVIFGLHIWPFSNTLSSSASRLLRPILDSQATRKNPPSLDFTSVLPQGGISQRTGAIYPPSRNVFIIPCLAVVSYPQLHPASTIKRPA